MASIYTYDQFEQAAKQAGLFDKFSQADLNLARQNADAGMSILKYKQDYKNATTDEARHLANLGAEDIRSSYGGYTGGQDGGSFHLDPMSPSSFNQQTAPTYENQYADQTKQLLDTIVNRPAFSWDPEKDQNVQAYQKMYTREGKRATQDTLAAASLATGGAPSSYAVSAATQAGDYYAAQMADKMPELYQQAYNRYLDEYSRQVQNLGLVQQAEQLDYGKFQDRLSQYNTDRAFDYGVLTDELNSQRNDRLEALEKAQLAGQYGDYSFLQDLGIDTSKNSADWEKAYQMALLKAQMGDYSGMEALGIDTSNNPTEREWQQQKENADWERNYQMALLAAQYGDYSGLRKLGITIPEETQTSTGGYVYTGGPSAQEEMSPEEYDNLMLKYPDGVLPAGQWAELANIYGEEYLTDQGLSKGGSTIGGNTVEDPRTQGNVLTKW